jgi:hypothetical protein
VPVSVTMDWMPWISRLNELFGAATVESMDELAGQDGVVHFSLERGLERALAHLGRLHELASDVEEPVGVAHRLGQVRVPRRARCHEQFVLSAEAHGLVALGLERDAELVADEADVLGGREDALEAAGRAGAGVATGTPQQDAALVHGVADRADELGAHRAREGGRVRVHRRAGQHQGGEAVGPRTRSLIGQSKDVGQELHGDPLGVGERLDLLDLRFALARPALYSVAMGVLARRLFR